MLFGEYYPIPQNEPEPAINGIEVKLQNPEKTAVVRLPSNQEVFDYLDDIAKRKTGDESRLPELHLFSKIRQDKGEEFNEDEADFLILKLTSVFTLSTTKEGLEYHVTLNTPFGPVKHMVRIPTIKELRTYISNQSKDPKIQRANDQKFYDKLVESTDGYAADFEVPHQHVDKVVVAIFNKYNEIDVIQFPNC